MQDTEPWRTLNVCATDLDDGCLVAGLAALGWGRAL